MEGGRKGFSLARESESVAAFKEMKGLNIQEFLFSTDCNGIKGTSWLSSQLRPSCYHNYTSVAIYGTII